MAFTGRLLHSAVGERIDTFALGFVSSSWPSEMVGIPGRCSGRERTTPVWAVPSTLSVTAEWLHFVLPGVI